MRFRLFSSLTRRILTVNILPLAILVTSILYLDGYRERLIETELAALETRAEIFAGALGEGAIGTKTDGAQFVQPLVARRMLRRLTAPTRTRGRLTAPTRTRARVFVKDGRKIADSRFLVGAGGRVEIRTLPPFKNDDIPTVAFNWIYDTFVAFFFSPQIDRPPVLLAGTSFEVLNLPVIKRAFLGNTGTSRWSVSHGGLLLGATAPVQRFKRPYVLGALLLTAEAEEIDAKVRAWRAAILKIFAVVLAVTVLLSLYLAGTIARPIRRLAAAADTLGTGIGQADSIPDFTRRRDEIGDLSGSLRDRTEALWQRMEANESFAADVAHEIKNPLTSLRSAVETVARIKEPEKQKVLMDIIQEDVKRLDRLISDISDASRLDAELAREQMEVIDLGRLLPALAQAQQIAAEKQDAATDTATVVFQGNVPNAAVRGIEGRLVQVFQNLISNAHSFTDPAGQITLSVRRDQADILVCVDDQGPGIPVDSLSSIFVRFYSERPAGETFGKHSGLGLSISRQIVEAHNGSIRAENLYNDEGKCCGARFVVRLPAVRV
ncbi:MAG: stimulus-sensing domain-containing protein [Pseudomonadota bacterium]|nr:stimulus-sensing domain-containing protein [Pseudomonadota bacterium]